MSRTAILNANYLMRRLAKSYDLPHPEPCMHEFVLSGRGLRKHGVKTLDVAKRLLDFGVHAPTVYFPLIVEEALMIERRDGDTRPTRHFAEAMSASPGGRREPEPAPRRAAHDSGEPARRGSGRARAQAALGATGSRLPRAQGHIGADPGMSDARLEWTFNPWRERPRVAAIGVAAVALMVVLLITARLHLMTFWAIAIGVHSSWLPPTCPSTAARRQGREGGPA